MLDASYDLSKVQPEAAYYVVIGFSAPYCLHLPNDTYKVLLTRDGKRANCQIVLVEKRRNIGQEGLIPGVDQIEKFADRRGVYFYSGINVNRCASQ